MTYGYNKIGLLTGGIWHLKPYLLLKKKKFKIKVFDDNTRCYIKQKKIFKLSEARKDKYKKYFFWSPCNDKGSALADYLNKIGGHKVRSNIFENGIFDKIKFLDKTKKKSFFGDYLLKDRFGSGSRNIFLWNKKKFNKKKFFIEKLYKGIEISIEVLSQDSSHKIICCSLRFLNKTKSAMGIFYFSDVKLSTNLKEQIFKKLKSIKILNGISHIECILQKNGILKFFDINLRCGGFGVSDYYLTSIFKNDFYEIDFSLLYEKRKKNIVLKKKNKFAFILYNTKTCNHFRKKLFFYKKNKIYKKFLNVKLESKNEDEDKNRTELLCSGFNNKNFFFSCLKKILINSSFKKLLIDYQSLKTYTKI